MKQQYRISVDLKSEDLFNFLEKLAKEHYKNNKSKTIRALLKEVKQIAESN